MATPKNVPYRPERLHFKHKVLGAQTAVVTGPADEEIYCDEYGRVKVQFHWDRLGQYNEHSSHWIRVANIWAHDRYGGIEIPRIGMEVMIDFIEGDIDNPIIRGAVHNGVNKVPYDLPGIKTQSTLKSKEYKGGGYNEVLLDDTTGEVKTQIHSTPGTSQLNLGYLTHPRKSDGGGEARGKGFELRTDEHGAIRAGKGIYVSANERGGAKENQLDLKEAIEQLEFALNLARNLATAAKSSEVNPTDIDKQQEQFQQVYKDLAKPGILTSAPEGIAMVTPKTAQMSAQENLTFTSGELTDFTAQKEMRVSAGKAINIFSNDEEIKLATNKGPIKVQAQNNNIELFANKNFKILSSNDRIEVQESNESKELSKEISVIPAKEGDYGDLGVRKHTSLALHTYYKVRGWRIFNENAYQYVPLKLMYTLATDDYLKALEFINPNGEALLIESFNKIEANPVLKKYSDQAISLAQANFKTSNKEFFDLPFKDMLTAKESQYLYHDFIHNSLSPEFGFDRIPDYMTNGSQDYNKDKDYNPIRVMVYDDRDGPENTKKNNPYTQGQQKSYDEINVEPLTVDENTLDAEIYPELLKKAVKEPLKS